MKSKYGKRLEAAVAMGRQMMDSMDEETLRFCHPLNLQSSMETAIKAWTEYPRRWFRLVLRLLLAVGLVYSTKWTAGTRFEFTPWISLIGLVMICFIHLMRRFSDVPNAIEWIEHFRECWYGVYGSGGRLNKRTITLKLVEKASALLKAEGAHGPHSDKADLAREELKKTRYGAETLGVTINNKELFNMAKRK